jgi:hypothetical protein
MHHIDYGLGILRAESLAPWPDDTAVDLADVYGCLLSEKQLSGYEVTGASTRLAQRRVSGTDAFCRQPAFSPPELLRRPRASRWHPNPLVRPISWCWAEVS